VDLIKGVVLSAETWKFFIVMVVMIMSFASSLWLLNTKKCRATEGCDLDDPEMAESNELIGLFYGAIYLSFGDFGMDPILDEGIM
jgi:hypothetical protein